MTFGVKNLTLLAICILINQAAAQWHDSAWNFSSSTAYQRVYLSTNLYAAPQSFILTNSVFARTTNIVVGGHTNIIPYYTNSVSTQKFLVAIGPDTNNIASNSAPTFSWELYCATNQLTTNVALVAYTYTATGTITRSSTNLVLDSAGTRDLDCYWALDERYGAISSSNSFAARFYRSHFENVKYAKAKVGDLSTYFLKASLLTNGTLDGWYSVQPNEDYKITLDIPVWSNKYAVAAHIGAPTNYFDVTLYRSVDRTNGLARILVCTNVISAYATNAAQVVTQNTYATWGEAWKLIGTNGQVLTRSTTNADIVATFTSGDYGQWRMRAAITNLQATIEYVFPRYRQTVFGDASSTNWTDTKADCETAYGAATETGLTNGIASESQFTFATMASCDDTLTNFYAAANGGRILLAATNNCTNLTFRCDVYLFPKKSADSTNAVFDANGHFGGGNVGQYLASQSGNGTNGYFEAGGYFGGPSPLSGQFPAWCAQPTDSAVNEDRGYYARFRAALFWSFKYK